MGQMTLSADSPCHVSLPQPSPHPPLTTPGFARTTPGLVLTTPGLVRTTPGLVRTTPGLARTTPGLVHFPLFPHSACRLPMPSESSQKAAGHSLRARWPGKHFLLPAVCARQKTKTWHSHTLFHKNTDIK